MLNSPTKKKLNLAQLKVQSFVTTLEEDSQLKGIGASVPRTYAPHSTCGRVVMDQL